MFVVSWWVLFIIVWLSLATTTALLIINRRLIRTNEYLRWQLAWTRHGFETVTTFIEATGDEE